MSFLSRVYANLVSVDLSLHHRESQKEAYDEAKEDIFVNKYKERGFGPWLSQRISGLMKKQGKGDRQTTNQEAEKHMACFGLSWVFCTAVNFTMKICLCEL